MGGVIFTGISALRMILETETDANSPDNETTYSAVRKAIEVLFLLLFGTGDTGSATCDPPDNTTGVLTNTGAGFDVDEHNGRTLLITSGLARGNFYTVHDTTATTVECTGNNLYSDGVRSGDSYVILFDLKGNADGHDHDGINSKSAVLADRSITTLKYGFGSVNTNAIATASGSVSQANGETITVLPGGEYGFSHRTRINNTSTDAVAGVLLGRHVIGYEDIAGIDDWFWALDRAVGFTDTGITAAITLYSNSAAATAYATQRYVTASGEVHWIFLLKDKATGEITCIWENPDHPCFGNGGKPLLMPHPFLSFDSATQEIVCINPTSAEVKKIRDAMIVEDEGNHNLNFIEAFRLLYDIDETTEPTWANVKVTVGLPDNWEDLPIGSKIDPVKKVIPKPAMVRTAGLKIKAKGMQPL